MTFLIYYYRSFLESKYVRTRNVQHYIKHGLLLALIQITTDPKSNMATMVDIF